MCVYRKVKDELPVCLKTKTFSCITKRKLKLCICVWTSMTWLRALESTLLFKIASRNSWETAQLSKMLRDSAPLTVQQFGHDIVSPEFLATLSFLNLPEAGSGSFPFRKVFDFFLMILKIQSIWLLVNSNAAWRELLIIFIALIVSPSIKWRVWPWQ